MSETGDNKQIKKSKKVFGKSNGFKKEVRGDVAELRNNVYMYGTSNQGDRYIKTTEAIAEYVGKEYNKAMRLLVKNLKESVPTEPTEPKEKTVSDVKMKKYEKELSRYYEKLDEYVEYKAKVFVIIKGQCTLTMKNKVESIKDYEKIEEKDDVIRLLQGLKELAFESIDVQYEQWTVCQSMKNAMTIKQYGDESLVAFYKRFVGMIQVTESHWGSLVPTKIGADKGTRNKFLACLFLSSVDRKRYGKFVDELNNHYLSGQNNYPDTIEIALTMLSHYKSGTVTFHGNARNEGIRATSFAQKMSNVTCYKCRKKGHYADACPEYNSDDDDSVDESSVASSRSRRSNNSGRTGWSG